MKGIKVQPGISLPKNSVMKDRIYAAIDLKSFYASVECIERGLDPMTTNLVVADSSRTEKTICLAVTPALKAYGISGRARLFEVVQQVKEANRLRKTFAPKGCFTGTSLHKDELKRDPSLQIDYIIAPPQMAHYLEYSAKIYQVYLKYAAPEDIHVYSIDEVFIDITSYLKLSGMTAKEYVKTIILDVLNTTGITATAGIGTNLYLCKVAMDIVAKHVRPDEHGVRIAELNESSYREQLWTHQPLTDFWRVGKGYAKKLEELGLCTMGDIARCSLGAKNEYYNEDLLYRIFGINAELLIDHAWGWEPCTIADIKAYHPENNSIGSGQVLHCPYSYEQGRLIVQEMTDLLVLDLVEKNFVTDQIVLTIGYDIENLTDIERSTSYQGDIKMDYYGRKVPKHAHGTVTLERYTSSTKQIMDAVMDLFERIVNPELLIRRVSVSANHVIEESKIPLEESFEQLELFTDYEAQKKAQKLENQALERERRMQQAVLNIKKKHGKNAILKGMNLQESATTIERNNQIGGHKA